MVSLVLMEAVKTTRLWDWTGQGSRGPPGQLLICLGLGRDLARATCRSGEVRSCGTALRPPHCQDGVCLSPQCYHRALHPPPHSRLPQRKAVPVLRKFCCSLAVLEMEPRACWTTEPQLQPWQGAAISKYCDENPECPFSSHSSCSQDPSSPGP
jgi:hypothetical protein